MRRLSDKSRLGAGRRPISGRKIIGVVDGKRNMKKLSEKARMYARSYGQPPYGREIEGTAELLLQMADRLERWEKKQIPQKVVYEDIGYDMHKNVNVYACICPSCGLHIIRFDDSDIKCFDGDEKAMFHSNMVHHAYIGLNNFCNRCGQKLDWE